MRKYLSDYIKDIEKQLKKKNVDWKSLSINMKTKIGFFQHERLVHLLVTLFFSLFMLITLVLGTLSYLFLIISFMLLCFVIPYIYHYYFLETRVQYLYILYDQVRSKI